MRGAAALLLVALAATAPARGQGLEPTGDELVRVSLLAEEAAIAPGQQVWLGVRLEVSPGWHVYWQNAGDSGVAPSFSWRLPPGLSGGLLFWPAPERLVLPGPLVNYVYEGAVVLPVLFQADPELAPGTTLEIGLDVSWLVCREECLDGQGSATLSLPVRPRPEPGPAALLLQTARAALPRAPGPEDRDRPDARWLSPTRLEWRLSGAEALAFFPLAPEAPAPRDMASRGEVAGEVLTLDYPSPPGEVRGLLAVRRGGETIHLQVSAPGPEAGAAPDPEEREKTQ